jgi:hypothetical protein
VRYELLLRRELRKSSQTTIAPAFVVCALAALRIRNKRQTARLLLIDPTTPVIAYSDDVNTAFRSDVNKSERRRWCLD